MSVFSVANIAAVCAAAWNNSALLWVIIFVYSVSVRSALPTFASCSTSPSAIRFVALLIIAIKSILSKSTIN